MIAGEKTEGLDGKPQKNEAVLKKNNSKHWGSLSGAVQNTFCMLTYISFHQNITKYPLFSSLSREEQNANNLCKAT